MATAELTEPVAELPRANVRAAGQFPEDQFETIPNVPVFAEHETKSRKTGRLLRFGPAELKAVADRCNRRIRETGDYSAIALGHTPDPETGGPMPRLVGFAGPFRLGVLPDGRHSILADFHVFREDVGELKRYPRRSPELWVEDRYEDMTLDPISLLGAEAPRLDMGILYSARRHDGTQIERYSAAFAGPLCVAPREEAEVPKHEKYQTNPLPTQEKPPMALDENDVRQIVGAIDQLDWVQWVKSKMQAETSPGEPSPSDMPPGGPAPEPPAPEPTPAPAPPPPRDGEPERHSRDASSVDTLRYAKMQADLAAAQKRADEAMAIATAEQGKRVDLERYQRLSLLRDSHLFDVDEEFEQVRYGKASDEQFEQHCQRIDKNYTRIPVGMSLPIPESPRPVGSQPGGQRQVEQYSKDVNDRALAYCKRELSQGREPDYADALKKAQAGEI